MKKCTSVEIIDNQKHLVTNNPGIGNLFMNDILLFFITCEGKWTFGQMCGTECDMNMVVFNARPEYCYSTSKIAIPLPVCKGKAQWQEREEKIWVDSAGAYFSDNALLVIFEGFKVYSPNLITMSEGRPEIIKEIISCDN